MFHGLCDGPGLNRFIEAVLYHYFCLRDGRKYSDEEGTKVIYERFPAVADQLFEKTLEKRKQTAKCATESFWSSDVKI